MSVDARAIALADEPRAERAEWLVFLRRLSTRRTALFGLAVVVLVVITAVAAPVLSPFDPIEQDLGDLRLKAPGFRDAAGRAEFVGQRQRRRPRAHDSRIRGSRYVYTMSTKRLTSTKVEASRKTAAWTTG